MQDIILEKEKLSKLLEPDPKTRESWTEIVLKHCHSFIDNLQSTKAYHQVSLKSSDLTLKIEDNGSDVHDIFKELNDNVFRQGLNPASGGHLGYIPGGGIYSGALGDFIAAVSNQYAGIFYGGPGAVKIENELIRWICRLIGFPSSSLGNLTSGGSIANLIAVVTAREAFQIKAVEIPQLCIYLTKQVHHSVHKAIRIAGLGEANIRFIDQDRHYRMDIKLLEDQINLDMRSGLKPFIVIGSAGTTDTGAVDPINAIADIALKHQLWFHVDAAYGGFFILSESLHPEFGRINKAFSGIEKADSVAIDPHKGLFLSYGLGAILIKDIKSMYSAHYYRAAYMQDTWNPEDEFSPADLSPELTKHFRGMRLWLSLKLHGLSPFKAALDEKILLCQYFYTKVQELGFEVGPYPDLSVCIYRFKALFVDSDDFNKAIVDFIVKRGRVFISSTTIDDVYWIRIAILSFRTHLRQIDQYLEDLKDALDSIPDA